MRHQIIACAMAALLWPAVAGAAEAGSAQKEKAQQIASELRESGKLSNYRVGVKYEDGVAWLYGAVSSEAQAKTALSLAGEVSGVNHVVSKLEITTPSGEAKRPAVSVKRLANKPAGDSDLMLAVMTESEEAAAEAPQPFTPAQPQAIAPQPMKRTAARGSMPRPMARVAQRPQPGQQGQVSPAAYGGGAQIPRGYSTGGAAGVSYDQANMPNHAWPSYAAYPNYAAVTYPKQYSPAAWPYIGPFYPYPQVPLGWRKVTLEWDDGWWNLDFSHQQQH
ncbi:periplasmic protein [Pseudobythopirellula maris]|uniref:Periplasmic protein n=1 Tax=Pseudobythopirellula maris TaxID=2527991 RepID=A0A5C5ZIJ0_9BACT|nr:BON domain-containing protein [Pseudobythopirellula maris]TWT86621.1 periplasmic protein [Pseudobythopirellula maris]